MCNHSNVQHHPDDIQVGVITIVANKATCGISQYAVSSSGVCPACVCFAICGLPQSVLRHLLGNACCNPTRFRIGALYKCIPFCAVWSKQFTRVNQCYISTILHQTVQYHFSCSVCLLSGPLYSQYLR